MKAIPAIILGCGGVGRALLQHIVANRALHCNQLGLVIQVVGVADSRSFVLVDRSANMEGLDDALLNDICQTKAAGSQLDPALLKHGKFEFFKNQTAKQMIINTVNTAYLHSDDHQFTGHSGIVLVDCSASSENIDLLTRAMQHGCCVVLANKKPLTCAIEDYKKLVLRYHRIRFESTVGAGLPIIASVNRVIASGDPISRIVGSLSGTLGYVMSELEDGKQFSQVVQAAKSLGYTEPDPRDDLGGMDVARKALILARLLGHEIELDDIQVESLYPTALGPESMSADDFMKSGLSKVDKSIEERVKAASIKGNVLRYVCVIEGSRCEVGLQELPKDSPLGRLRGSDNVVEIYSRCYNNSPLVIQGAGAGNDTTAAGVLADIVDLQDHFKG